jgi:hypothetical protein
VILAGVRCKNQQEGTVSEFRYTGEAARLHGESCVVGDVIAPAKRWTWRIFNPSDSGPPQKELVLHGAVRDVRIREGDRFSLVSPVWLFQQMGVTEVHNNTSGRVWRVGPIDAPCLAPQPPPSFGRLLMRLLIAIPAILLLILCVAWLANGNWPFAVGALVLMAVIGRKLAR